MAQPGLDHRDEFFAAAPPGTEERLASTRRMDRHARRSFRERLRFSPLQVFAVAFILLLGSAVAVALAQFTADHRAPWISIALSGAAVVCTVVALLIRPRR